MGQVYIIKFHFYLTKILRPIKQTIFTNDIITVPANFLMGLLYLYILCYQLGGMASTKIKQSPVFICLSNTINQKHRLQLLKLDKQISGTIYWPNLAANEAQHLEGVGCHVGGGTGWQTSIENKFTRTYAHFTFGKKLCPLFYRFFS